MTFRAANSRMIGDALLFSTWLLLASALLAVWARNRTPDWLQISLWGMFAVGLLLTFLVLYRVWTLYSLAYQIERNALIVRWRTERVVLPIAHIKQIVQDENANTQTADWWRWPTPFMRVETQKEMRQQVETDEPATEYPHPNKNLLIMLATRPLNQCLVLDVAQTRYALSPSQRDAFIEHLQKSYQQRPNMDVAVDDSQTFDLQIILGVDKIARRVLIAGLIGVLLLFGVLLVRYPFLPETMAVRFNAQGLPELVRPKSQLYLLPMIGLVVWVANTLWGIWMAARNQPTGAYLLWSGSLLVQLCLLMALLSLVQ